MGVEKLYESENYLVVNKPCDMYINSDDENEKVIVHFPMYYLLLMLFDLIRFTSFCYFLSLSILFFIVLAG